MTAKNFSTTEKKLRLLKMNIFSLGNFLIFGQTFEKNSGTEKNWGEGGARSMFQKRTDFMPEAQSGPELSGA